MANIWEKPSSIMAGNLNSHLSYLITTVLSFPTSIKATESQNFFCLTFKKWTEWASKKLVTSEHFNFMKTEIYPPLFYCESVKTEQQHHGKSRQL